MTHSTTRPQGKESLYDFLREEIESRTSEYRELGSEIESLTARRWELGGEIRGMEIALRATPDYDTGAVPDRGASGAGGESETDVPDVPLSPLARQVLRYARERGQFFHINEVMGWLAAQAQGSPESGSKLPGNRTVRTALEKLRVRGDLARSVYANSTQHHFHGTQDCVRIGPDGPEYASPHVAPSPELLAGVEDEPPTFDYVEGWPG